MSSVWNWEKAVFVFWHPWICTKERFFSGLFRLDGPPQTDIYRGISYVKFNKTREKNKMLQTFKKTERIVQ